MKKILLATTVLAATTGYAAAEVKTTGDARMGVYYNGTDSAVAYRARAKFGMSGETDSGLSFGAGFNVTNEAANVGTAAVSISGAFGSVSIGNDNDNSMVQITSNVPHLGVMEHDGGSRRTAAGSGSLIAYTYSAGALTMGVSSGQISSGEYSAAVKYASGDMSVALGYEDDGAGNSQTIVTGTAAVGGVALVGYAGDNGTDTQVGFAGTYSMDATAVTLRVKQDFAGLNHMGLGVVYDLGGAKVGASVNNVEGSDTTAGFGISMSF